MKKELKIAICVMEVGFIMTKNNDPFGFQKAINFKALKDPKIIKQLEEMFARNEVSIAPNVAYKKSVNFLKSKTKKR